MRGLDSVRVRGEGGGLDKLDPAPAEVVGEEVGESPIRANADSGRTREVVLGNNRVLNFVVLTDIVRGHTVDGGFDLLAIRIVNTRARQFGRS